MGDLLSRLTASDRRVLDRLCDQGDAWVVGGWVRDWHSESEIKLYFFICDKTTFLLNSVFSFLLFLALILNICMDLSSKVINQFGKI